MTRRPSHVMLAPPGFARSPDREKIWGGHQRQRGRRFKKDRDPYTKRTCWRRGPSAAAAQNKLKDRGKQAIGRIITDRCLLAGPKTPDAKTKQKKTTRQGLTLSFLNESSARAPFSGPGKRQKENQTIRGERGSASLRSPPPLPPKDGSTARPLQQRHLRGEG